MSGALKRDKILQTVSDAGDCIGQKAEIELEGAIMERLNTDGDAKRQPAYRQRGYCTQDKYRRCLSAVAAKREEINIVS
jgi:hypothetical protein